MTEERLQKILARAGLASRREAERWIEAGRVTVNGRVARLGDKADPEGDDVRVDGEPLRRPERPVYVALHKPRGVVSSLEAQGPRRTVRDLVDLRERVYPVGRLDVESEGLILLTNDGDLANCLTHPRYGVEKEYRVLLDRVPDGEQLKAWRHGVVLPTGERTLPAKIQVESQTPHGAWVRVVMKEGRKRQIREVAATLGLRVKRLIRVRIGTLRLGKLPPGAWRPLSAREVETLRFSARRSKRRRSTWIVPRKGG